MLRYCFLLLLLFYKIVNVVIITFLNLKEKYCIFISYITRLMSLIKYLHYYRSVYKQYY